MVFDLVFLLQRRHANDFFDRHLYRHGAKSIANQNDHHDHAVAGRRHHRRHAVFVAEQTHRQYLGTDERRRHLDHRVPADLHTFRPRPRRAKSFFRHRRIGRIGHGWFAVDVTLNLQQTAADLARLSHIFQLLRHTGKIGHHRGYGRAWLSHQ